VVFRPCSAALVVPAVLALARCHKPEPPPPAAGTTEVRILVDAEGYHPAEAHAPAGKRVRLVLTRTTEAGCGEEIVIPSANLRRSLPIDEPVVIDLTMPLSGKLAFTCGMDMMRGAVTAE